MYAIVLLHRTRLVQVKTVVVQMEFEYLPFVNLVWHDLKLQHGSSTIVEIERFHHVITILYTRNKSPSWCTTCTVCY